MTPHTALIPDAGQREAHVKWPAERFFWGILDVKSIPKRLRKSPEQLGFLLENVIPGIAIEQVHCHYCTIDSTTVVACGVPHEALQSPELHDAITLSPADLPRFVKDKIGIDQLPHALNLLTGPFTPKRVRSMAMRWKLVAALALVACASTIVFGIERRNQQLHASILSVKEHTALVYQQVLPPGGGSQPAHLRLVSELRQLEQTRSAQGAPDASVDNCGEILANLMRSWPGDVHLVTESISITPKVITVRGQVPAMAEAQRLADAMKSMSSGWQVAQPQSEARKDHVDLSLRIDRVPEKSSS